MDERQGQMEPITPREYVDLSDLRIGQGRTPAPLLYNALLPVSPNSSVNCWETESYRGCGLAWSGNAADFWGRIEGGFTRQLGNYFGNLPIEAFPLRSLSSDFEESHREADLLFPGLKKRVKDDYWMITADEFLLAFLRGIASGELREKIISKIIEASKIEGTEGGLDSRGAATEWDSFVYGLGRGLIDLLANDQLRIEEDRQIDFLEAKGKDAHKGDEVDFYVDMVRRGQESRKGIVEQIEKIVSLPRLTTAESTPKT